MDTPVKLNVALVLVPVRLAPVPPFVVVNALKVNVPPVFEQVIAVPTPVVEMLLNVTPLAPAVVLAMLNAVALVLVIVLLDPVTFTLPPPVALKPALLPESIATPVKLKVALALLPVRVAPVPPLVVKPVNVNAPATLERLTPVPVVVVTATSLTLTPVIAATGSFKPGEVPVERFKPCTRVSVSKVTVPRSVGRTPPIEGREAVPAGGLMPIKLSKVLGEFVAPWPISHSPELSAALLA
jgi:hypothetical protein